jgi:hypothetical protein
MERICSVRQNRAETIDKPGMKAKTTTISAMAKLSQTVVKKGQTTA